MGFLLELAKDSLQYLNIVQLMRMVIESSEVFKFEKVIGQNRCQVNIVQGILGVCKALSIEVIAEGVQTQAEYRTLRALGVAYFQGYWFARPAFEQLPPVCWPDD